MPKTKVSQQAAANSAPSDEEKDLCEKIRDRGDTEDQYVDEDGNILVNLGAVNTIKVSPDNMIWNINKDGGQRVNSKQIEIISSLLDQLDWTKVDVDEKKDTSIATASALDEEYVAIPKSSPTKTTSTSANKKEGQTPST